MERILPAEPYRRWRGRLITLIFAIMIITFITLLVLLPVLYVRLSTDYNEQVITCSSTNIITRQLHA